jgi:phage baseplate assembly protein W
MAAARKFTKLGSDLALTRYVGTASAVSLESADSWGTLDVQVVPGLAVRGSRRRVEGFDLGVVSERNNLAQALILRLLTKVGELAPLGHPDYGSRLTQLIGGLNNETTRNLARLYTIEAVAQEPRCRLTDLSVAPVDGQPGTIRIGFTVLPIDDDDPLALALDVTL